jgi:hypothetical protein
VLRELFGLEEEPAEPPTREERGASDNVRPLPRRKSG